MARLLRFLLIAVALGWSVGCLSAGRSTNPPATMVSTFNGQYAFLLTGFDTTGNPMAQVAGSMTADGKGDITAGSADVTELNFRAQPRAPLSSARCYITRSHSPRRDYASPTHSAA